VWKEAKEKTRTRFFNFVFDTDFDEGKSNIDIVENIDKGLRDFVHVCLLGGVQERFNNLPIRIIQ
jgi:hypothetical protein